MCNASEWNEELLGGGGGEGALTYTPRTQTTTFFFTKVFA